MSITNISAVAGSQDLPQLIAPLFFEKGERPCSLLRLAGSESTSPALAGRTVSNSTYSMSVDYQLEAPAQPSVTPGAAPAFKEYGTEQETNIVQIFHRGVGFNYDVLGDQDTFSGLQVQPGGANGEVQKLRKMDTQIGLNLEAMRRDMNLTFLKGTYHVPTSNSDPAQSRGLCTAVTTHSFANSGTGRALSTTIVNAALKTMVVNGAMVQGTEVFALADATQFSNLAALYVNQYQQPQSYEVAGLGIKKIITDWGIINLVWEPDMATGKIAIVQPKFLQPVVKVIPGKGTVFIEPLATTGSAVKSQIYGEVGLDYGSEFFHALIGDLN